MDFIIKLSLHQAVLLTLQKLSQYRDPAVHARMDVNRNRGWLFDTKSVVHCWIWIMICFSGSTWHLHQQHNQQLLAVLLYLFFFIKSLQTLGAQAEMTAICGDGDARSIASTVGYYPTIKITKVPHFARSTSALYLTHEIWPAFKCKIGVRALSASVE